MNWLIYHVASGTAFFSGAACVLAAVAIGTRDKRWVRRVAMIVFLVGVALITISSTPLSLWYYVPAAAAGLFWLVLCDMRSARSRYRKTASGVLAVVVLLGVALEVPYHITPSLPQRGEQALVIFGDSVTAGMGEDEAETWPSILHRTRSVAVHDFSQMGATAASALKKARRHTIPDGIVLLEIGGNDLLGSTTANEFHQDLEALLAYVSAEGRQVMMFELPLPPLRNTFGRIQRELAREYNVALVPKRAFMRVLTADQATLDSIHLSQIGHRLMAEAVWKILRTPLKPRSERS